MRGGGLRAHLREGGTRCRHRGGGSYRQHHTHRISPVGHGISTHRYKGPFRDRSPIPTGSSRSRAGAAANRVSP
ncbi:hypothetical protein EAH84_12885 [Sphingomonas oligophenolica]|uniref:Uncharacterized protein n=1 Tax=Sphingomonas oligophenolica TaxID=301154 RepID=A0A502CD90_9SPHN|nr:hypothetical protein EAH84_12885 [Sphingomonas oligophenolica]